VPYLGHHEQEERTMNPIRIAAVAALVLVAAALAGVGLPEQARSDEGAPARGITVTASGKVESIPDRAALEIGVETQAGSAKSAMGQNADRLADVIDALRKAGVAKDDLQTSQVYLWPQRESDGNTVTGYQAQNTVSVVLDVEKAGAAVDAAVAAGANVVSGPSLSVADRDELYREALKDAVEAGRAKARAIADAAGVKVGRVTAVVESAGYELSPPMPYAAQARDSVATTQIAPGKQAIEASVTVTFAVA
jgi:uncharacterized protein